METMDFETLVALANYDHIVRSAGLDMVSLDIDTGTLIYGAGKDDIDILREVGFTPATAGWQPGYAAPRR
jgi:hypothetical protein